MKKLNADVIPRIESQGVVCNECVAIGMFDNGVVVDFLEKDYAVLIEWEDLVTISLSIDRKPPEDNTAEKKGEIRKIDKPKGHWPPAGDK